MQEKLKKVFKMITEQRKIIMRFEMLSNKYHKLSLLFYELSKSMEMEARKNGTAKEFKAYIKSLNLDYDKIRSLSLGLSELTLKDLQKGEVA